MRALTRCLFTLGATLVPVVSEAQELSTVAGRVVHKTSQRAIEGAEVVLNPRGMRLLTDTAGRFRFTQVAPGSVALLVRHLGFRAETVAVDIRPADDLNVEIELQASVQSLDTVSISAREDPVPRGKLSAFYERKQFGIGRFIEAKDIEQISNRKLADVLLARVPGVRAIRAAGGSSVFIGTSRMSRRARGGSTQHCLVDVYLDGGVVYSSGRGAPFDVNTIDPQIVAAIEFYSGPGQIPTQYNKMGSACGVLLIWTK